MHGVSLPVNFSSEEVTPTFDTYAELLRAACPRLFSGGVLRVHHLHLYAQTSSTTAEFHALTEFGRAMVAKAGVIASRVEYTKVRRLTEGL